MSSFYCTSNLSLKTWFRIFSNLPTIQLGIPTFGSSSVIWILFFGQKYPSYKPRSAATIIDHVYLPINIYIDEGGQDKY